MPILDYSTNPTGIFRAGGKIVKTVEGFYTTATQDGYLKEIDDIYSGADLTAEIATIFGDFDGIKDSIQGFRQRIAGYFDARLRDYATVLKLIGLQPTQGIDQAFWEAFWRTMILDSATVNKNTVTAAANATAAGGNTGTGTILITKLLDGFSPPVTNGPALLSYAGVTSELAVTETMRWLCTSDAGSGSAKGGESLAWQGSAADAAFGWRYGDGSGVGPILTAGSGTVNDDPGFEQWGVTDTPALWTIGSGLASTHVFQDTTAAQVYRGTSSIKFVGDGAISEINVFQSVADRVTALRLYCLSCRVKCSANAPAAGDFSLELSGTGYTPGAGETVTIAHGALTTSWQLGKAFVLIPAAVAEDLALAVNWGGTPTAAVELYIDEVRLQEVVYHGGLGAVALAGQTDFLRGDNFTLSVTNDNAGVFQRWARRWWAVQLPSSGTPSISDTLAT